ncbi:MAG: MFS transporter [Atopobiaceae bacterium]|nr:MFS transporter [Atopobiaceae bacterium]
MADAPKKESLFRMPNYPAWFGADTALLTGSAVHWIVISLMAYELSGSVTMAGWFFTIRGIMSVVTQVVGGAFVDRHDHRTLLLAQSGICGLLWLTMGILYATGNLTFARFMVLCLSSSAVFGLLDGTSNAALITVVGPERYAQAESLNQGRDAAVRMAGSPLGAALYCLWNAAPFFASALCDGLAFLCSLTLRLPERPEVKQAERSVSSFVHDLIEGWQWVFASKTIVNAVVIMGIFEFGAFAMRQAINLQMVSSGVDPLLISLVNVISGVATLVGSIVSSRVCDHVPVGRGVVAILAFMALGYVPLLFSSAYPSVVLSSILTSLPMPLFGALVNGFVFSKTPVDRQGRTRAAVMTAIMFFGSGSGALAGELLPRIGFTGFVIAMMVLVLCSVVLAAINPRIRRIPASPEWASVEL